MIERQPDDARDAPNDAPSGGGWSTAFLVATFVLLALAAAGPMLDYRYRCEANCIFSFAMFTVKPFAPLAIAFGVLTIVAGAIEFRTRNQPCWVTCARLVAPLAAIATAAALLTAS